jgi:hypothetical protein
MSKGLIVWEGDQKSLFRKYADRRKGAMQEILGRLEDLKEEGL